MTPITPTPTRRAIVARAVELGMPMASAWALAQIPASVGAKWVQRSRQLDKQEEVRPEDLPWFGLARQLDEAQAALEWRLVRSFAAQAGSGAAQTWPVILAYLERVRPEVYRKRDEVQVTGGESLLPQIVLSPAASDAVRQLEKSLEGRGSREVDG